MWNDIGRACGMHGRKMHTGVGVRKSEQTTWKIQSNDTEDNVKLNWTVGGRVDSSGSAQAQAAIVVKIKSEYLGSIFHQISNK